MQTLGMSQFSYGLFSNAVVWDAWKVAVLNIANGASDAQIQAAGQFSDYVMKIECETVADQDGCCMFLSEPMYGGWCLFQNGATMDTYRMKHENSLDFMNDAFSLNQGDYQEAITAFKMDPLDLTNVDYFNYFHCGTKGAAGANVFTCHNFQPNWTDLGETNGYPRFGRLDPVVAGYINAGLLTAAPFYEIRLWNGAASLTSAAFAIGISFLAF